MSATVERETIPDLSPDLEHFIELAYRGRSRASTGSEQGARKLALAFLDHGLTLDRSALEGLIKWQRCAKLSPNTARRVIG
jgi:hypothetical protein